MTRSLKFGVTLEGIWRFCLLVILWTPNLESTSSQCELCNKTYTSCSMQFPQYHLDETDCRMQVFGIGSTACSSMEMEIKSHGETSGRMMLQSYLYQEMLYKQTGLNVTFSGFSWKNVAMRFMQNGYPVKNSCRIFHFSEKFLQIKPTSLFYDCLWSHNDYEEKTFNFEYVAKDDDSTIYRKYVFTVPERDRVNPNETELKTWQIFVYVDITDSPFVVLRAQTLPDHYGVRTYNVKAYSGNGTDKSVKGERNITVYRGDKEISFEWNLGIFPGNYFLTVQPMSEACGESGCMISRSPDIKIEPSSNLLYAGGAFALLLLFLFIIACIKYIPRGETISVRPKLLLIYRSTHTSHMRVVLELAQHLRRNCNIEAMCDELDIHKSETQNPFEWYNDAIEKSDFIAIVSSPTCCNSINSIYPNVNKMALTMLQGRGFCKKRYSNNCNLMVFLLPYCSEKTLPAEAKNIGLRFRIPNDINEVVNYVHNFRKKHFIGRLYYCIKSNFFWYVLHGRASLKKCPALYTAIQDATGEVKKCPGIENGTELRTVESDKKIPIGIHRKDSLESIEQPSSSIIYLSESSGYSVPNQWFPGNIENLNLQGIEPEVAEEDDSRIDNKEVSLLDGLIL